MVDNVDHSGIFTLHERFNLILETISSESINAKMMILLVNVKVKFGELCGTW
jgi:hypothetical protein